MAEKIKNLLIAFLVLLLCCQLALSFALVRVYAPLSVKDLFFEVLQMKNAPVSSKEELLGQAFPALPCHIALCSEKGAYSPFSAGDYTQSYGRTSAILSAAAEEASDISPCDEKAYQNALSSFGILYIYDYPLPFYLFFGQQFIENISPESLVYSVFVCANGDKTDIYLRTQNGGFFVMKSDFDAEKINAVCQNTAPNAVFALSVPEAECRGDIPLVSTPSSLPFYITVAPSYAESREIPEWISDVFSVNRYLSSVYADLDSLVCIEGDKQIRLGSDGSISFSASSEDALPLGILQDESPFSALRKEAFAVSETALTLWTNASNGNCGLTLSEIKTQSDVHTYIFDCSIGGCLVERTSPACTVSVKNGKITALSMLPLCFFEGEETSVFPYIQAAAAQSDKNADLHIHYIPTNPTVLMPQMRVVDGGR